MCVIKPIDFKFSMPAGWAPHSGCWMGWPARESIWHGYIDAARDAAAAETLRRAYPGREVVSLELRDLFRGGGGIHCITQQEPRARAA